MNSNMTACTCGFCGFIEALIHIYSRVSCSIGTSSMKKRTVGLDPYLLLLDRIAFSDLFFPSSWLSQRNENIGIQEAHTDALKFLVIKAKQMVARYIYNIA